ncbi:hypothetical protein NMY22_g12530 [Coprinellus aureogranulatus]|nr:hypothetical protein NMY22_g12530 [Coprinellus aureogranulatus]
MSEDTTPTIELALRLWDSRFQDGAFVDISDEAVPGLASFFNACLGDGQGSEALVDIIQYRDLSRHFLGSLNRRFGTLAERATRGVVQMENAKIFFESYASLIQGLVRKWSGLWTYLLRKRTIVAFARCLLDLAWAGNDARPQHDGGSIASWALTQLEGMIKWVRTRDESFIASVAQLASGDAIRLIYACHVEYPDHPPLYALSCSLLQFMEPYLPYSPFCLAVKGSSEALLQRSLSQPAKEPWAHFQASALKSMEVIAEGESTFSSSCDNNGHSMRQGTSIADKAVKRKRCSKCQAVFYCSTMCQKEDWRLLHRSECDGLQRLRIARLSDGLWTPYGTKGSLAAVLLRNYSDMMSTSADLEGTSNDLMHILQDAMVTLDFRAGDQPLFLTKLRETYLHQLPAFEPTCVLPRIEAALAAPRESACLVVEAIFPHNHESIHILARIVPTREGRFNYANGIAMITRTG